MKVCLSQAKSAKDTITWTPSDLIPCGSFACHMPVLQVAMRHINLAVEEMFNAAHMHLLFNCCRLDKILLAALLLELRARGKISSFSASAIKCKSTLEEYINTSKFNNVSRFLVTAEHPLDCIRACNPRYAPFKKGFIAVYLRQALLAIKYLKTARNHR